MPEEFLRGYTERSVERISGSTRGRAGWRRGEWGYIRVRRWWESDIVDGNRRRSYTIVGSSGIIDCRWKRVLRCVVIGCGCGDDPTVI